MGLFSGIVKAVAAPVGAFLGGPVGGAIGASLAGSLGASEQNAANFKLTKNQMQFQRDMSNTAHQREVLDLQAAGLNPMLTGKYQGASTPPGALTSAVNTAAAGDAAAASYASRALIEAQIRASESQTALNSANAAKVAAETQVIQSEGGLRSIDLEIAQHLRDSGLSSKVASSRSEAEISEALVRRIKGSMDYNALEELNTVARSRGFGSWEAMVKDIGYRQQLLDAAMSSAQLPKERAMGDFYSTAEGKKLAPYLATAESAARVVGGVGLRFPRR